MGGTPVNRAPLPSGSQEAATATDPPSTHVASGLQAVSARRPTAAVLMQEYVRQGRSLRSVAEAHRLSVAELRELIVGYGLPLHRGTPPVPRGTAGLTAEHLRVEYEQKGRSAADIATEMAVSEQSVLRYLHRFGIPVRRGGSSSLGEVLTADLLREEYVENARSAADIAETMNVSEQTVLRYLHRHGIPIRSRRRVGLEAMLTTEYLQAEYVTRGRSVADLAREHGVSDQAIRNWLTRRGIPTRRASAPAVAERLTYAYLHREYEQRGRSVAAIAEQAAVSEQSVLRYLHRHGIPVRRKRSDTVAPLSAGGGRGRPAWLGTLLSEEYLRREYEERGRSAADIARQVGASEQSVLRYLHQWGISVRPAAIDLGSVFTREYLEAEYVGQGRSLGAIGRAHGVSGETVRKWLARHDIERRRNDRSQIVGRDTLDRWYVGEGSSISAIARSLGVSATTVAKYLDRYGIERRPSRVAGELIDRGLLEREYVERGRTLVEIARDLGISASTVRKQLDRHEIAVRPKNAKPLLDRVLSPDYLRREYVDGARTAQAIASEVGVSEQTVLRYLRRHDLPVRPAGFGPQVGSAGDALGERDGPAPAWSDGPSTGNGLGEDGDEERLRAWLLS